MKRTLSLLLAVFLVVAMLVIPTTADTPTYTADTSWYNTTDTVFEISTPQQLLGLGLIYTSNGGANKNANGRFLNKTIKIMNDIDLNPGWDATLTVDADGNVTQTPVAPPNAFNAIPWFCGTIDGQGHTIKGFYSTKTANKWGALIENAGGYCAVKNLTIEGYIKVTGSGSSNEGVGGLIGVVNKQDSHSFCTINNVTNRVNILMKPTNAGVAFAGGFIGRVMESEGTVLSNSVYGGTIAITSNWTKADTTAYDQSQMIACGKSGATTISNVVAMGKICATKAESYGQSGNATITNWYAGKDTTFTAANVQNANGAIQYAFSYDNDHYVVPAAMVDYANGYVADTSWYNDSDSVLYIANAAQFFGLSELANGGNKFSGKTIKLTADIDLNPTFTATKVTVDGSGKVTVPQAPANLRWFRPLPTFSGTIDGQGHTVSGLYGMNTGAYSYGAFITTFTPNGVSGIRNISFTRSFVSASANANTGSGAIIGGVSFPSKADFAGDRLILENIYADVDLVYNQASGNTTQGMAATIVGRVFDIPNKGMDGDKPVYPMVLNSVATAGTVYAVKAEDGTATAKVLNISQLVGGGQWNSASDQKVYAVNCSMQGAVVAGIAENYSEAKILFENLQEGVIANVDDLEGSIMVNPSAVTTGGSGRVYKAIGTYNAETAAFVKSETLGRVVPAGVAYLYNNNVFAQAAAPAGDKFSVRLLSAVETLDWNRVGFLVTVEVDGTTYYNAKPYETQTVFSSVLAAGETVTAAALPGCDNCSYVYALVLANLPATGTVTVTVTPTRTTPAKTVLSDLPAATFTFVNGVAN